MAFLGQTMWLLVVDCNNESQSDEVKEERKELQILAEYRQRNLCRQLSLHRRTFIRFRYEQQSL